MTREMNIQLCKANLAWLAEPGKEIILIPHLTQIVEWHDKLTDTKGDDIDVPLLIARILSVLDMASQDEVDEFCKWVEQLVHMDNK